MVLLVVFSGLGVVGASFVLPGAPEQLVEGHTVFLTINAVVNKTAEEEYAAAVAVLVRDFTQPIINQRFPGVLWFNDQYLVDPDQTSRKRSAQDRYPCDGAIIGVNHGDPVDYDPNGWPTLHNETYLESYYITDTNEQIWQIDLWLTQWSTFAWTVGVYNGQRGDPGKPDDGKCRGPRPTTDGSFFCAPRTGYTNVSYPYDDSGGGAVYDRIEENLGETYEGAGGLADRCYSNPLGRTLHHKDPGDNGLGYPCEGCDPIQYNALLYFRLDHLDVQNRSKDHREYLGEAWWDDAAGCHADRLNNWPCPNGDDAREGNSHPYNPDLPHPFVPYDGRDNHGGSDICRDGNRVDCHGTFDIDLYFGYNDPQPEFARDYYVYDVIGAEAPYHCHDDNEPCDHTAYPVP